MTYKFREGYNKLYPDIDEHLIDMIQEYHLTEFKELDNEPNEYDKLARDLSIGNTTNPICPIKSNWVVFTVTSFEKRYEPKENSGINSWYSKKDYSNDDRFRMYYDVYVEKSYLYYELADFLKALLENK